MKTFALLFPGQGAQYVGMGKTFLANTTCKELFEEARSLLSVPLQHLMFDGPQDELTKTAIAQPAILLHSIMAYRYFLEECDINVSAALGHSLGEYSALVAAGVIRFADALRAVHIRGTLMQEAVPANLGAMSAVLGMKADDIVQALAEYSDDQAANYVACANFNGPWQTVIAGTKTGVKIASEKLKSLGARRIIELSVSAPFHCALMKPVQKTMAEVLSAIEFNDAQFPIITNVHAYAETSGAKLRDSLIAQIVEPVRFTDSVNFAMQHKLNSDGYIEFGPKTTLSGITGKMDIDRAFFNVDVMDDVIKFRGC